MKFNFSIKDYIYIGLITLLLAIVIFRKNRPSEGQILIKHTQDSLRHQIAVKTDSIAVYEDSLVRYKDQVSNLQKKIAKNTEKIKIIHQSYETKTRVVDSWDITELKQFFSDRYNKDNN